MHSVHSADHARPASFHVAESSLGRAYLQAQMLANPGSRLSPRGLVAAIQVG